MSIGAAHARSNFVANTALSLVSSACCLFSSTAPFLRAAATLSTSNGRGRFWTMTVLGLTFGGLKLCYQGLEILKVCMMWIRIWRQIWKQGTRRTSNDGHGDQQTLTNGSLERRQVEIENALTTTTYKALIRENDKDTWQALHEENNYHDEDEHYLCSSSSTLPSKEIHLSPTITQTQIGKSCVICLENFENNDKISFAKGGCNHGGRCKHIFHSTCLRVWLKKHNSCPMCRHCMLPNS